MEVLLLTTNQINYLKVLEDRRSHQANEDLGRRTLTESQRHNLETESQGRGSVAAQQKQAVASLSNAGAAAKQANAALANAVTQAARAKEDARHNLVSENQNFGKLVTGTTGTQDLLGYRYLTGDTSLQTATNFGIAQAGDSLQGALSGALRGAFGSLFR